MLGIPVVTYVSRIEEIDNGHMRLQRMVEDGYETVETPLPALITVVKEINTPRLPSLRGLAKAKSAVIPVWDAAEIGADQNMVGRNGSATWVTKIFFPQRARQGEILEGSLEDQTETLINRLRDSKLI